MNITTKLINCPELVPDELKAGPEATAAAMPDGSVGGLANFAQETEAGRLSENRDKRAVNGLYERCWEENKRLNTLRKKRFLGLVNLTQGVLSLGSAGDLPGKRL